MDPLTIAGGVIGLGKVLFGIGQNSKASSVVVPNVDYKDSPYATSKLNLAKVLYGGRMPGAAAAEQNLLQNNSNTSSAVQRNASSGAQALSMLSAIQGQTDSSLLDLRNQEAGYSLNMLNNLNQANDTMSDQWYKNYLDEVRTQEQKMAEKSGLRNAAWQNIGGGANEIQQVIGNQQLLKALKK